MNSARISQLVPRALGWGALVVLCILGVLNNSATRIHTWPWAFYTHLALLVPFLLLGLHLISGPSYIIRGIMPLVTLAGVIALSVFRARHPVFSFEVALLLWSGLSWSAWIALRVADWRRKEHPASISSIPLAVHIATWVLSLPLLAAVCWALSDLASPLQNVQSLLAALVRCANYRNPHPFGHWNYTGGYALLVLPWLGVLVAKQQGCRRAFYSALLALGLVVLFWTFSRGAVLGLAAMTVAAVASFILTNKLHRGQFVGLLLVGLMILGALIASNGRLRAMVFHPAIALRPSEGDVQRLGMLQAGWLLIKREPWLGYGPGMTPFVYPEVRAHVIGGVETSYQLHNGYLQFWADHGLLGLLAGALVAGLALRGGWAYLRDSAHPPLMRSLGLASMYSFVGYIAMAATDYQLNVPWIVGALGLHLGVLLSAAVQLSPSMNGAGLHRATGWAMLGATILGTLLLLVPDWRARQAFWAAWWATPEKDLVGIITHLEDAAKAAPGNPFYRTSLGLQLATTARLLSAPQAVAGASRGAITELQRSLLLDSAQEPVYAALGWLYLSDNPKRAEAQFLSALKLIPDRDTLHLGLALARLTSGDRTGGIHALALECIVDPAFLASPYWDQNELNEIKPQVMAQLFRAYDNILLDPRTPEWRKPALRYARAWSDWWIHGTLVQKNDLDGAEPDARAFFSSLIETKSSGKARPIDDLALPLRSLIAAQQDPTQADHILRQNLSNSEGTAIQAAVARLSQPAQRIEDLLRSPPITGEQILSRPIYRLHYNIMCRNLDGPGYADLAPRDAYAFFATFVTPILPSKGIVPGPVLKTLDEENLPHR